MLNTRLRAYPRGFLGGDIVVQVAHAQQVIASQVNHMQYKADDSNMRSGDIQPNPYVESLYTSYTTNNITAGSPEFRTAVLKVALSAFGTTSFLLWVINQYKNPLAGNLHNDFILDTLKFISTGARDMSLENWMALITIGDGSTAVGTVGDKVKEFFNVNKDAPIETARFNIDLLEVIQTWCSKPNGLEDLLGTMHILFGK